MSSITFDILFLLLLIIGNGVLAMAEIAVVSARKARLQQWANEGDPKARAALELANAPTPFLSTIQMGITLVGVLAGALGGTTIARALAARLGHIPWLGPYSEAVALGLVVVAITYLSLVLGELVPKRLALHRPERIAAAVAPLMRLLSVLTAPAARLLSASTELVLRGLGVRPAPEPPVTEEEIIVLLEQGMRAGMFEKAERLMVESVFRLGDRRIGALMTPRTEIVWLDVDDPPEELRHKIAASAHASFLVAQGSIDNVLGLVDAKDIAARCLAGQGVELRALVHPPPLVPESMRALKLLEVFKQSGAHTALVIDEYGALQGLVTLHDLLEAIIGEIRLAGQPAEPQMVQREDGSWLVDGLVPVDEFKERFQLKALPGEEEGMYQTLGGFVMMRLGRIPAAGDHFDWHGLRFEVVDMDGYRVDKVLVAPVPPQATEPATDA
jgi:putative hemolysin